MHRLGVGIGGAGGKVPGRSLGTVAVQPRKVSCVRSLICSTVLGAHLKIKVNNCPFVRGSFQ
jgi:hypothetical protein